MRGSERVKAKAAVTVELVESVAKLKQQITQLMDAKTQEDGQCQHQCSEQPVGTDADIGVAEELVSQPNLSNGSGCPSQIVQNCSLHSESIEDDVGGMTVNQVAKVGMGAEDLMQGERVKPATETCHLSSTSCVKDGATWPEIPHPSTSF